jgi:alpha-L-fucosidase
VQQIPCVPPTPPAPDGAVSRAARLQWWREARFGMFIHWGIYSLLERGEWVMACEGIPPPEYEQLADRFAPAAGAARRWAALAKRAGMRYVVLTAKHHDGFCLFDSRLTEYSAARRGCGRDLIREFVEAAQAEGLAIGLYYSLTDWHHPDAARATSDEAARRRLVDYTHGQLRELMTDYGQIDILWYDSPGPLGAAGWEAERMNRMVFALQPRILVNDRNGLPGDFATFERRPPDDRPLGAWETCTTINDCWGYHAGDRAWKSPQTLLTELVTCVRDDGNYLLNIGPRADGSVPERARATLAAVGRWLARNGESIYGADGCARPWPACALVTKKANTLFVHVRHWPGETLTVAGLPGGVAAARLLASAQPVVVHADSARVRFVGLPRVAPDAPLTTLALEYVETPALNQKEYGDEAR